MKTKIVFICFILSSFIALGQQRQLIHKKNVKSLSKKKKRKLLSKSKAYKSVDVVNIDLENILNSDELTIQFNDEDFVIKKDKIKVRDLNNYSFYGKNKKGMGSSLISVLNGNVQGTITHKNKIYTIETIEPGNYALIELDQSEFVENCGDISPSDAPKKELHSPVKSNDENSIENDEPITIENENINYSYNPLTATTPNSECKIRIAVLYTNDALAEAESVESIINTILLGIEQTNQSLINSNINHQVELVFIGKTEQEEELTNSLMLSEFHNDNYAATIRSKYNADICMLIINNWDGCGIAYRNTGTNSTLYADYAYGVVNLFCATRNYSFAHEVGHILGCNHDFDNMEIVPKITYSYGFQSANTDPKWRTIMAYDTGCSCPRMLYWSSPDITYDGVPMGTTETSDNARVWRELAEATMAFKQPEDMVVIEPNYSSNNLQIIAKQNITNNGAIIAETDSNIVLKAGNQIELTDFKVHSGAGFAANIESITDCGFLPPEASAKVIVDNSYADTQYNLQSIEADKSILPKVAVSVFPNPASNYINIEYSLETENLVSIKLVNFLGITAKNIFINRQQNKGVYKEQMAINSLPTGTYFLIINIGDKEQVKKIIIN